MSKGKVIKTSGNLLVSAIGDEVSVLLGYYNRTAIDWDGGANQERPEKFLYSGQGYSEEGNRAGIYRIYTKN